VSPGAELSGECVSPLYEATEACQQFLGVTPRCTHLVVTSWSSLKSVTPLQTSFRALLTRISSARVSSRVADDLPRSFIFRTPSLSSGVPQFAGKMAKRVAIAKRGRLKLDRSVSECLTVRLWAGVDRSAEVLSEVSRCGEATFGRHNLNRQVTRLE
jgi:hypothetical protein